MHEPERDLTAWIALAPAGLLILYVLIRLIV